MDNREQQGRKSPVKVVDLPEEDENANQPAVEPRPPAVEPRPPAVEPDVKKNAPSMRVGAVGGLPVMASGRGACGYDESLPLGARNPMLVQILCSGGNPSVAAEAEPPNEMAAKRLKYAPIEEEDILQDSPDEEEYEVMEEEEEEDEEIDAERHRRQFNERSQPGSDDECLNRKL